MAPFEKVNIPQKPPMVMVNRLVSIEGKTTITAFRISPDNIFVEKGLFREPGLIENMAQTAAAGVGAHSQSDNAPPPEGFIGGIRNLKIEAFPAIGDEIVTRVTVMHEIFDATVVLGEVFLNEQRIASCELKIFLIPQKP